MGGEAGVGRSGGHHTFRQRNVASGASYRAGPGEGHKRRTPAVGDDVAVVGMVLVVTRLVTVFGVATEIGEMGVVELRFTLVEQDIDGDDRAQDQVAQVPGQIVGEFQGVAVLGGEEVSVQAGVLLADTGNLEPGGVGDRKVPIVPVSADLGDVVTAWIVEPETGAPELAVLDDDPVGLAVWPGDVDVGTTSVPGLVQVEERMPVRVVDGETMRTSGAVSVPGRHVLVDEGEWVALFVEDFVVSFACVQPAGLLDQEYRGCEQGCVHGGLSGVLRCEEEGNVLVGGTSSAASARIYLLASTRGEC